MSEPSVNGSRGQLVFTTSPEARFRELRQQVALLGEPKDNMAVRAGVVAALVQARAQYDVAVLAILKAVQLRSEPPAEGVTPDEWASRWDGQIKSYLVQLQECLGFSFRLCPPQGMAPRPPGVISGAQARADYP